MPQYRILAVVSFLWCVTLTTQSFGDDPKAKSDDRSSKSTPNQQGSFVLKPDVRDALFPLFKSIADADVSRVTVELASETLTGAQVVDSQISTYQIGSKAPDHFTIYLKEPHQRLRVFCDGKEMIVAMSPEAYFRAEDPIQTQRAVTALPVPMGPYPEPVLALSLAGVDPSITFLGAMQSVEILDRGKFRGEIPAIHFRGLQDDGVSWQFWISQEDPPKPLRLLVDLTPMLRATQEVQIPENYSFQLRYDFLSWRMSGEVDPQLFKFNPPATAVEYKSLDEYYAQVAATAANPLMGKPAPTISTQLLSGQAFSVEKIKGKVVVLDFWATWCAPCIESQPIIAEVCREFADQGVQFISVNTGETKDKVTAFVNEHGWKSSVSLDPDGKYADAYKIDAIPQTVIVGPDGTVQAVHVGFVGKEALREQLRKELKSLVDGERLIPKSPESRSEIRD
jgi:thiol-disulfide isomerase/thioredoxin